MILIQIEFFFVFCRLPVEMSCVSVETMFPYHTATASALLNSMLSATPRSYGWTLEGKFYFFLNYCMDTLRELVCWMHDYAYIMLINVLHMKNLHLH